jgi:hypothetical protein
MAGQLRGWATVMHNIMDPLFNGMARSELYRACLLPDVFPNEQQMLLQNWSWDDLVMFCGGDYLKGAA